MANEEPGWAALIAALDHSDKAKLRATVDELIVLGSGSAPLKAFLEQRLADSASSKNRWTLAYILAQVSPPSSIVLSALEDALDHDDAEIRWAVALLLTKLARSNAHISERLMDLYAGGTPTQRRMALYCMRELRPEHGRGLEVVFRALADPVPLVRVAAVITLKATPHVGDNRKQALLDLFLNDPDARVRNVAAITLATLGSPSEQFLTALREAANSAHPQTKKAAFAALSLLYGR